MLNISSFFKIPAIAPHFNSIKASLAPYVSEALKAGQAFFENPRPLLGRVNWKIALPVALLITVATACIFFYSRKQQAANATESAPETKQAVQDKVEEPESVPETKQAVQDKVEEPESVPEEKPETKAAEEQKPESVSKKEIGVQGKAKEQNFFAVKIGGNKSPGSNFIDRVMQARRFTGIVQSFPSFPSGNFQKELSSASAQVLSTWKNLKMQGKQILQKNSN